MSSCNVLNEIKKLLRQNCRWSYRKRHHECITKPTKITVRQYSCISPLFIHIFTDVSKLFLSSNKMNGQYVCRSGQALGLKNPSNIIKQWMVFTWCYFLNTNIDSWCLIFNNEIFLLRVYFIVPRFKVMLLLLAVTIFYIYWSLDEEHSSGILTHIITN